MPIRTVDDHCGRCRVSSGRESCLGVRSGARLIHNQFREPDASIRVEVCPGIPSDQDMIR